MPAYSHVCFVVLGSWLACKGGWIFGAGRLRHGLALGAASVVLFLIDHWIFD